MKKAKTYLCRSTRTRVIRICVPLDVRRNNKNLGQFYQINRVYCRVHNKLWDTEWVSGWLGSTMILISFLKYGKILQAAWFIFNVCEMWFQLIILFHLIVKLHSEISRFWSSQYLVQTLKMIRFNQLGDNGR